MKLKKFKFFIRLNFFIEMDKKMWCNIAVKEKYGGGGIH